MSDKSSPASTTNTSLSSLQRVRRAEDAPGQARGSSGLMRMYAPDDAPGIKVDPIVVLVMSLVFIGSVFLLHIWGKYARA